MPDVVRLLTDLGSTMQEIADTLRAKNVRGLKLDCTGCPVSNYLKRSGFVYASVTAVSARVRSMADALATPENDDSPWTWTRVMFPGNLPNAWALRDFIREFDYDAFPDLILSEEF